MNNFQQVNYDSSEVHGKTVDYIKIYNKYAIVLFNDSTYCLFKVENEWYEDIEMVEGETHHLDLRDKKNLGLLTEEEYNHLEEENDKKWKEQIKENDRRSLEDLLARQARGEI
jgi:hypothetical protein